MLGWIIAAGLVALGIYVVTKKDQPGIFKISDRFLTGGDHITFTVIQNPGSRSVKHIRIGFGGMTMGNTVYAIEIKRGATKDWGERLSVLIKVDVAVNQSNMLTSYKPKTSEYSGWMSKDDWSKIKPYLEPITNLQYLFVD